LVSQKTSFEQDFITLCSDRDRSRPSQQTFASGIAMRWNVVDRHVEPAGLI
jgi:hypothetical protein